MVGVAFTDSAVLAAFGLTLLAGLATGIGSVAAFFTRRTNKAFLSSSLGFSAGVMIYVSFVELLPAANRLLADAQGDGPGAWAAALSFLGGVAATALIDLVIPSAENPHDASVVEDLQVEGVQPALKRVGLLTAAALALHNFPEGFATFVSVLHDLRVGIPIAFAIALHNIPEGLAVAIPIYFATGNRRQAFWYSFLAGLAEPVGAMVGFLALQRFLTDSVVGASLAAVAGVMVFISLDQLIPNAKKFSQGHYAVYGLIAGMAVMAFSLLLL
ncbi:MAG: zinc transporter ZupT [Planctomycetota bacterium]|nr:zinc transporter ZupT [Planctomycetota bacterium]